MHYHCCDVKCLKTGGGQKEDPDLSNLTEKVEGGVTASIEGGSGIRFKHS